MASATKNLVGLACLATALVLVVPVTAAADDADGIQENTTRLTNGIVASLADNVPAAIGLAVIVLIVSLAFAVFRGMGWN